MRLNLSEIEDRSFDALPASQYVVEIADFEMRKTKGGPEAKLPEGTDMINWTFNVIRDAKTNADTYKNRKLFMNTIIHERTLFNLKALLKACGFKDADLADEIDFEPQSLIGNQIVAVVVQRPYNGDTVNDVRRVLALGDEQKDSQASVLP